MVIYQNQPNGSGGTMGVMTVYSNDSDGDLADEPRRLVGPRLEL